MFPKMQLFWKYNQELMKEHLILNLFWPPCPLFFISHCVLFALGIKFRAGFLLFFWFSFLDQTWTALLDVFLTIFIKKKFGYIWRDLQINWILLSLQGRKKNRSNNSHVDWKVNFYLI